MKVINTGIAHWPYVAFASSLGSLEHDCNGSNVSFLGAQAYNVKSSSYICMYCGTNKYVGILLCTKKIGQNRLSREIRYIRSTFSYLRCRYKSKH